MATETIRTAESVTEGHPNKVADYIADSLLDAFLVQDPGAHTAIEVLAKNDRVVVAGEVGANATVDVETVVRTAIRDVGYTDPAEPFNAGSVTIDSWLHPQAREIAPGVGHGW